MKTFDVRAICLRATPYDEAHQIVTFYTAEEGVVRAIAKGVKKSGSKLRGACEPLTLNHVTLIHGRNLHTVSHYDRENSFPNVRLELERMAVGSVAMDLLATLGRENDPDSQSVYDLLEATLTDLDNLSLSWIATSIRFQKAMLSMSGYELDFCTCVRCAAPLALKSEPYFAFSPAMGGFLCHDCESSIEAYSKVKVSTKTLQLFEDPASGEFADHALKAHRFLHYYWANRLERPLQSFEFLFQLFDQLPVDTLSG